MARTYGFDHYKSHPKMVDVSATRRKDLPSRPVSKKGVGLKSRPVQESERAQAASPPTSSSGMLAARYHIAALRAQ